MADAPTWAQLLVSSGVVTLVAGGALRVWRWTVERPLEQAEARARKAESRADQLAEALKDAAVTATTLRRMLELDETGTPSIPPPRHRDELPTLTAIVDLRREAAYAEEAERSRQRPLNPSRDANTVPLEGLGGRQDYADWELARLHQDTDSTPPRGTKRGR